MTDFTSPTSDQELYGSPGNASSLAGEHGEAYGQSRPAVGRSLEKPDSVADFLIYWLGFALIAFIQSLPLIFVARLGRLMGSLTYYLDARHRRIALGNLGNV